MTNSVHPRSVVVLCATLVRRVLIFLGTAAIASARTIGSISGRVLNEATNQYLNNARVPVKGTDLTAFTDDTGTFCLSGVPVGAATLEAFYSGLDPLQFTVNVTAGQNVERDINLTNKVAYGDKPAP